MLKLTLVVSWIFSVLMAETICVCFSGGWASWRLLLDGAFSLDSAPFMPLSRFIVPDAAPPVDGAVCCVAAPPDVPSRLMPVPCAFAKPVPAIRAATAAEINKRLVIEVLLTCLHCPRRQRKEMCDVPAESRFRQLCLVNGR